jgi:hypothetical protein
MAHTNTNALFVSQTSGAVRIRMNQLCAATSLAITLWGGVACGVDTARHSGAVARDSLGIEIVENAAGVETAARCSLTSEPLLSLGTVDGPEETRFFRIWRVKRLRDGAIGVVNQGTNELRIFDVDGSHRLSIGRTGEGPNEYLRLWEVFQRPDDSLVMWDYRQQRLSVVSPTGGLGRTMRFNPPFLNEPTLLGLTPENGVLLWQRDFLSRERGFNPVTLHLMRYDSTGRLVDTLGQYPYGTLGIISEEMRFAAGALFEPRSQLAAGRAVYAVSTADEAEVEIHDYTGRIVRIIRWTAGDRTVSTDDVTAYFERRLAEATGDQSRRIVQELRAKQPIAERFPTVSYLTFDDTDRLWVFGYQRPLDEAAPPVLIFGSDGRLVCAVELPESGFVDGVGLDWVLAVERDADDVEYVRMYGLRAPTE